MVMPAHATHSALHPRRPGGLGGRERPLPEGVQLLKGSVVRRTPTRVQLGQRKSLVLTERDRDILLAVHQHGFLTAELIELAFFPAGAGGRTTPSSAAYDRLRQLWLWSFVDRIELPVARAVGGGHPYLYTLGQRGVPVVADALGAAACVRRRRLDRLDDQFLDHDVYAARLWANLRALLQDVPERRVHGWSWVAETELRARHLGVDDPQTGRRLPFLPDGYFEVTYWPSAGSPTAIGAAGSLTATGAAGGDVQCCVVEIDTGTLSLTKFRRKLRGFELALRSGLFAREWRRPSFEVAILTGSEARLHHLWHAARAVVPRSRWDSYSLGTFAALNPELFPDYDWLTLAGERVPLLYDNAYAGGSGSDDGDGAPSLGDDRRDPPECGGPVARPRPVGTAPPAAGAVA